MSDSLPAPTAVPREGYFRVLIIGLLSLSAASAYLTRVISGVNTSIAAELHCGDEEMGELLGAFSLGYFLFQVPGGWLASTWGVRKVLPTLAVLWSAATVWFAFADTGKHIYLSRIALGIAQAGLVPCCAQAIKDWLPVRERGLGSAAIGLSMQLGGAAAGLSTGLLLQLTSWHSIYAGYSLTGLAWAAAFAWLYRDRPADHPRLSPAEAEWIAQGKQSPLGEGATTSSAVMPWEVLRSTIHLALALLLSLPLWLICAQSFFRAFSYDFYTTWYAAFLEESRDVSASSAAMLNALPILAFGVGNVLAGLLIDTLLHRWKNPWLSRCLPAALALLCCGLCTLGGATSTGPTGAVVWLTCGMFLAGAAGPSAWAATMEVGGRHAAVAVGVMNMTGNIGSWLCPIVLGWMFAVIKRGDGEWSSVLYLMVAINFAGAVCWLLVNPARPIKAS